ncbi:MAG TPA: recombination protein O N-terminal domain-containing protein, partial [Spirochaetales bacterium]|nr:recombination protein O N-terminal domain-containing protein [Spirochaetales bacterium]
MASRSVSFDALVLRTKESPAGHRIAQLLCKDGVLDAFIFGGPKAKLRSLVSPWHAGRAWIYDDKSKGFLKLTDFDALEEFPRVRSDLSAIGAASLASEFILATD